MNQPLAKVVNLIEQMNLATDHTTHRFPISCLAVSTQAAPQEFEGLAKAFDCVIHKEKESHLYTFRPSEPKEGQHNEQSLTLFVLGLGMCQKFSGSRAYLFMTNPLQELINENVENPYFHSSNMEQDQKVNQWLKMDSPFRVDPICLHSLQMAGFAVQNSEAPIDIPTSNIQLLHEEMKNWEVTTSHLRKVAGL